MGETKRFKVILAVISIFFSGFGMMQSSYAGTPPPAKDRFVLVIDPGHGGKDPGAIGRFSREKNINLSVAKAFGQLVEKHCPGVKVIYTRKTDVFIPLDKRADIANKADADLFISIHTNALPGKAVGRGAETYTLGMARAQANLDVAKRENAVILVENDYKERYQGFDPNSSESYIMFEFMQDKYMEKSVNFAKMIQKEFKATGGRQDKGVHQAGFLVLRQTSMPSVLIELGYISTHDEETFLNSQNGIKKMSQSIFNAFMSYAGQSAKAKAGKDNIAQARPVRQEDIVAESAAEEEAADIRALAKENEKGAPQEKEGNTPEITAGNGNRPIFKIQLMASTRQIPTGSARFKNLSPIGFYKEGDHYKYTYGATADYREAQKIRDEIKKDFEGAFIVAFRKDEKIELKQAIEEYKKNK